MAVHVSHVIEDGTDIYGDGVNVAARLQSFAETGGIAVSEIVTESITGLGDLSAIDLGETYLHNRAQPVRIFSYRIRGLGDANTPAARIAKRRPSIAVLPFQSAVDASDDYFSDGMIEAIIQTLASLKELRVIARGSTIGLRAITTDVREIGKQLGVQYVLDGSYEKSGEKVSIRTQLVDTDSAEIVCVDSYNRALEDIFELQDEICREVVKSVAPNVRQRELRRALRKHPQNLTAYELVLQALNLLNPLDYDSFNQARGLLQKAISADPSYARAFSYAAWWHSYHIGQEWSQDVEADSREALRLAEIAARIDPDDALALAIYGHELAYLNRDYGRAMEYFDRAVEVCPSSAESWTLRGATQCFQGNADDALMSASNGIRLSPRDSDIYFAEHILAQAHYINRDYDEAIVWCRRAVTHNGRLTSNLRTLMAALVVTGQVDEARKIARRHAQLAPKFSLATWASRTPLVQTLVSERARLLREAGLPE